MATKKLETWSPFKQIDSKEPEAWKKERWYAGDINGCMGGPYFTRLGKAPTNPPDSRSMRIMRMGKQMELLLVNDIKRHYLKPYDLKKLFSPGYLFSKLKEVFWNDETFEKIKKFWYDEEKTLLEKFQIGLDIFEEGWEKVCFNGYIDPDIINIETQRYIRDEELEIGMRIDLLIICKKKPSIIYEIKSINSKAFWWMEKEGTIVKEEHKNQCHLYLDYLIKEIPNVQAKVLYISRDDMTTKEAQIFYDKDLAKLSKNKFKLLNEYWKKKEVPPVEPAIIQENGKYSVNWKAKYCSHHGLCMKDLNWEKKAEKEVAELNLKVGVKGKKNIIKI